MFDVCYWLRFVSDERFDACVVVLLLFDRSVVFVFWLMVVDFCILLLCVDCCVSCIACCFLVLLC